MQETKRVLQTVIIAALVVIMPLVNGCSGTSGG